MTTTSRRVFVSYSHAQSEIVRDHLVPCLRAAGLEVFLDIEQFVAGRSLVGQMDAIQDQADATVACLSPEYGRSDPCLHELRRAIARDPKFETGTLVPVKVAPCALPKELKQGNPLYCDLGNRSDESQWRRVVDGCGGSFSGSIVRWLDAKAEVVTLLDRAKSVNLVVGTNGTWRALVDHVRQVSEGFQVLDLQKPTTASRRGLVEEIAGSLGRTQRVPDPPEDLTLLDRILEDRGQSVVGLLHFDLAASRPTYDVDLFAALRYWIVETRRLVLFVESRQPFRELVPERSPLSDIDISAVYLQG